MKKKILPIAALLFMMVSVSYSETIINGVKALINPIIYRPQVVGGITGDGSGTITGFDFDIDEIALLEDGGVVTLITQSVTATPAAGTEQGMAISVDGNTVFEAIAEADGAGGIQEQRIRVTGAFVSVMGSDQSLSDDGAVTPSRRIVRVGGNGAAATLDTDPAIADGYDDGQELIIQGTSDANTVAIADACNTQLSGGNTMTLGQGDTIYLIWDSGDSVWMEVSRSDN